MANVYRGNPYDLLNNPTTSLPSQESGSLPVVSGLSAASPASFSSLMNHHPFLYHPVIPPSFLASMTAPSMPWNGTSSVEQDLSDDDQPLDMSVKKKNNASNECRSSVIGIKDRMSHTNKLLLPFAAASLPSPGNHVSAAIPMPRPSVITAAPSNKRGKLERSLGKLEVNGHHERGHHRTATVTRHSSFGGSFTSPSVSSHSSSSSQESDRTASKLQILSHGSSSDEETNDPVAAHFRRSLGRSYSEVIRSKSYPMSSSSLTSPKSASGSSASSTGSSNKQENDGITDRASKLQILSHGDSSDEETNEEDPVAAHFRRSLGVGYSELITRGKSASISSPAFTASKSDSGSSSSSTGSYPTSSK